MNRMTLRSIVVGAILVISLSCLAGNIWAQAESGTLGKKQQPSDRHVHDHDHDHDHDHPHSHAHHPAPDGKADQEPREPALAQWGMLGIYSILIAIASLFGGWLPSRIHISHLQFQLVMSTVGGLILGIGLLHLLPHAIHEIGPQGVDVATKWSMAGILMMFFLLRAFHVHHHQPEIDSPTNDPLVGDLAEVKTVDHSHSHESHCDHHHAPQSRWNWIGIFFGLAVHTLLDGVALGATMQAESQHGVSAFAGLGVFLAIALHKPLDSLSITTLMINAGRSTKACWIANLGYATLCPIGAAAFLFGVGQMSEGGHLIVGITLAFSAGVFICIALSDLLPEMEFHSHNRIRLSTALLLGIGLAWAIQFLEPAHLHN